MVELGLCGIDKKINWTFINSSYFKIMECGLWKKCEFEQSVRESLKPQSTMSKVECSSDFETNSIFYSIVCAGTCSWLIRILMLDFFSYIYLYMAVFFFFDFQYCINCWIISAYSWFCRVQSISTKLVLLWTVFSDFVVKRLDKTLD